MKLGESTSMKALPKRKRNAPTSLAWQKARRCLNESPSKKEGKSGMITRAQVVLTDASMKVPPRRKGNIPSNMAPWRVLMPQ